MVSGMARIRPLFLVALALLSGSAAVPVSNGQTAPSLTAGARLQNARDAVQTLQTWYDPTTGLYKTTGWWNSANALTVLIDFSQVSKSTNYNEVFTNTFTAAQKTNPGFLNNFYDDEGWWALAWIDAYDLTRIKDYLSMSESIFADMAAAWDDTCGGGIWWSKDRHYKNAIANELFLSVAAHLANRTSGATRRKYLAWGNEEWKWFHASGMINTTGLINDGLSQSAEGNARLGCTNNGRTTWTYNQGVIIGGLAVLYEITGDDAYLAQAEIIAAAALRDLTVPPGILTEPGERQTARRDRDRPQFKGVFVRHLFELYRHRPRAEYRDFILANATSLWQNSRNHRNQLGLSWTGPFDRADAVRQSSALDALNAALAVASPPT